VNIDWNDEWHKDFHDFKYGEKRVVLIEKINSRILEKNKKKFISELYSKLIVTTFHKNA
jgi:hypothetical protein